MSTTYRIIVHCDEQKTDRCLGLLEAIEAGVTTPPRQMLDDLQRTLQQAGWLRGYSTRQSHDVCPACRPLVATEDGEPGG